MAGTLTIGAGLTIHFVFDGDAASFLADALYAVLAYLVCSFVRVGGRRTMSAAIGLAFCWAIEFFQLTGVPTAAADRFAPTALILGTTFQPGDLLAYTLGILLALAVDLVLSALVAHQRPRPRSV